MKQMIADENELLAAIQTDLPSAQRVLAFAPHPDDEVFGCGGLLARMADVGAQVAVIVVTDGAAGGENAEGNLVQVRSAESRASARVLGIPEPTFWGLPDRGLVYGEVLVERIMASISAFEADCVLLPSPIEVHPDHQVLALAGAEALRRLGGNLLGIFYEVNTPLQIPNLLIDISALVDKKREAMRCFVSQLAELPYDVRMEGLSRFRSYFLGAQATAAEAFMLTTPAALAAGLEKLFEGVPAHRQRLGFAVDGAHIPLVSIIVRSMDRPTLARALDTLALQTWLNLEVVVVNAKGGNHTPLAERCGRFPLRLINQGGEPLSRPRAANVGLTACHGRYLGFLDDDDTVTPDHLQALVTVLQKYPEPIVAYTGVHGVAEDDPDGLPIAVFASPEVDFSRLLVGNLLPIHAPLFPAELLQGGLCVDESLDIYEDWDFWLQLARQTPFVFTGQITARYHQGGNSAVSPLALEHEQVVKGKNRLFTKWLTRLKPEEFQTVTDLYQEISHRLAVAEYDTGQLDGRCHTLERQLQETGRQLQETGQQLQETERQRESELAQIYVSRSWRITRPLRFLTDQLRRLAEGGAAAGGTSTKYGPGFLRHRFIQYAKTVHGFIPLRFRPVLVNFLFGHFSWFFRGLGYYENWRSRQGGLPLVSVSPEELISLDTVPPYRRGVPGTIAVHAHIYYPDLVQEFAGFLHGIPFPFDLYLSVKDAAVAKVCQSGFSGIRTVQKLEIAEVANRGRDIAPFICNFGDALRNYDIIAHIHTKKSLYAKGTMDGWREYLMKQLLGSEDHIRRIFSLLYGDVPCGLVYPQPYRLFPYWGNTWLSNRAMAHSWASRLGIDRLPEGYFDYPVGSFFWARGDALEPLFSAGICLDDFEQEAGQKDGTLAHCLERLFVPMVKQRGFGYVVLKDQEHPDWSSWRLDQYLLRSSNTLYAMVENPTIKIVAFDIFDTLLLRPLTNPEQTKAIIAARAPERLKNSFIRLRQEAEGAARLAKGSDVALSEIYDFLRTMAGLSATEAAELQQIEQSVEIASTCPRTEAIDLFKHALAVGKRVILISDMYLSADCITQILNKCGINGYHKLYLSSVCGVRKDSGLLYRFVLKQEQIRPDEMVMIGDNEQSDLQMPLELGISTCHLLRPVVLASVSPRFKSLLGKTAAECGLNGQLAAGLVINNAFQGIAAENLNIMAMGPDGARSIGYAVAGPLIVSFVQWVAEKARQNGITALYFLAREGQIFKEVYDRLFSGATHLPSSRYLMVSRRAVTVPALRTIEDIYALAEASYHPTPLADFLKERYGYCPTDETLERLYKKGIWAPDRQVELYGSSSHLKPLLAELAPEILAHAATERTTFMAYCATTGLGTTPLPAVVDIGYSATIQGALNALLGTRIDGLYMITEHPSQLVCQRYNVTADGYFAHRVNRLVAMTTMLAHNFDIERLLSADDTQVVAYQAADDGVRPVMRESSIAELESRPMRAAIRSGIRDYVDDVKAIQSGLKPDFVIPAAVAEACFEAFVTTLSADDRVVLDTLALDDHYCGRGVVGQTH
jgi:predicted HAD superfamily hydrolase/LmbE family N-acetylglucosaminyl deacetylase